MSRTSSILVLIFAYVGAQLVNVAFWGAAVAYLAYFLEARPLVQVASFAFVLLVASFCAFGLQDAYNERVRNIHPW